MVRINFFRICSKAHLGKAFYLFASKRYADSAKILENYLHRLPDEQGNEVPLSVLGQCYLALGQTNRAIENMERSFQLYQSSKELNKKNKGYFEGYQKLLEAYAFALEQTDKKEIAEEIIRKKFIIC